MNQQVTDAGVPVVAGSGIVLRYHPLTLVIEPASDVASTATAAAEVADGLLSAQSFDFASVANALQGLVVAEQPLGVAAVVDVENPIIFLFDQAAAEGSTERHQSEGRSGWTTAYASSEQVALVVGSALQQPAGPGWMRLAQGIVGGSGAHVQLGLEPAAPVLSVAETVREGVEPEIQSTSDEASAAEPTQPGGEESPVESLVGGVGQVPADFNIGADSDTDSDFGVDTDPGIDHSHELDVDTEIEVLETEFATEALDAEVEAEALDAEVEAEVEVDDAPNEPVSSEELRRTIAAASLAAATPAEEIVEASEATADSTDLAEIDPSLDELDPDTTVTEVLDRAELGLPAPDEDVLDVAGEGAEIDLVVTEAELSQGPDVIAGPPPMPTPEAQISYQEPRVQEPRVQEPRVIAGPPPMPDAVIDVTSDPETIVMPDPMTAAGPEPTDDEVAESSKVIAGPPPMPDESAARVRS